MVTRIASARDVAPAIPYRPSPVVERPLPRLGERFGIRSSRQVARDFAEVVGGLASGKRFQSGVSSAGLLRPDLAIPAYRGWVPEDGRAPIFNLFDRVGGGLHFSQRVTRRRVRDFRGGRLSYDEHDGVDFVCPVGTPLVAAAPGLVVLIRDRWLRGGLTVAVDHGSGVLTQYTHCSRALAAVGARVERGEPVALSGAAGYDLVQFFPMVPPHVHFMVWIDGRPIDPFLADGERSRAGVWMERNTPRPSGPLATDPKAFEPSAVDAAAVVAVSDACSDSRIRAEIAALRAEPPMLAALLEDALHHDSWAWPEALHRTRLRPRRDGDAAGDERGAASVAITMPLPAAAYSGCFFADSRFTRPRAT